MNNKNLMTKTNINLLANPKAEVRSSPKAVKKFFNIDDSLGMSVLLKEKKLAVGTGSGSRSFHEEIELKIIRIIARMKESDSTLDLLRKEIRGMSPKKIE